MKESCEKCGHNSEDNLKKFGVVLCRVCFKLSPNNPEELDEYTEEKIDSKALDSFRKFVKINSELLKSGMVKKATIGNVVSRPPFGYNFVDRKLVPAQNFREVEEIFEEFLNNEISLRNLSRKHNLSVNGLKKILTNFTYIGKVKFNGQIHEGNHKPIVSSTLFNHVQNKIENLKIKK